MPATAKDSCICIYASGLSRRRSDPDHLTIEVDVAHGSVIDRPGRNISPMFRSAASVQLFRHPRRAFLSPDHDEQRGILSAIIQGLRTPFPLQDIHWGLNDFPAAGDPAHTLDEIIDGHLTDVVLRCAKDGRITSVVIRINKLEKVDELPAAVRDDQPPRGEPSVEALASALSTCIRLNVENRYRGVGAVEIGAEAEMECPICMLGFVKGKQEIGMPCQHIFHRSCIVTWLQKSPTCPICRFWLFNKSTRQ